jgi:hypothetical protein
MWPFPKKPATLNSDTWMVGQGTFDGETFFIRMAESPKGRGTLAYRFGIAILFKGMIEGKYPDTETANYLAMLEDSILEKFASLPVEHTAALTLPNVRELVFYTSVPAAMLSGLNEIRRKFPATTFQHYSKEDREWLAYREFQSMIRKK